MSPAISKKQQIMMAMDLKRARRGEKTKTGMSTPQLKDFASTKRKGLPARTKAGSRITRE